MKTYRLRVEFEPDEDGWDGWSAFCPALEDQGAFTWGQTWEKARESIIKTLELVTGSLIDSGLSIPEETEDSAPLEENQICVAIEPKLKPPPRPAHLQETYRFHVLVEPDEDEWFACCPTLVSKGAATGGSTKEEAYKNIHEVLEMVIETMIELGEYIPQLEDEKDFPTGERIAVTL